MFMNACAAGQGFTFYSAKVLTPLCVLFDPLFLLGWMLLFKEKRQIFPNVSCITKHSYRRILSCGCTFKM